MHWGTEGHWRINRILNSRCFILLSNIELHESPVSNHSLRIWWGHQRLIYLHVTVLEISQLFLFEDTALVFCEVVMVSLWGLLKYWHKSEMSASVLGWPHVSINWLVFFKKGKRCCSKAPKHGSLHGTKALFRRYNPSSSTSFPVVVDTTQGL